MDEITKALQGTAIKTDELDVLGVFAASSSSSNQTKPIGNEKATPSATTNSQNIGIDDFYFGNNNNNNNNKKKTDSIGDILDWNNSSKPNKSAQSGNLLDELSNNASKTSVDDLFSTLGSNNNEAAKKPVKKLVSSDSSKTTVMTTTTTTTDDAWGMGGNLINLHQLSKSTVTFPDATKRSTNTPTSQLPTTTINRPPQSTNQPNLW